MELKELSTDTITGSVCPPRQQPYAGDRHRLMRSIEQNGLKVPIIALRARGKYLLVSGHRRVGALSSPLREGKNACPTASSHVRPGVEASMVFFNAGDGGLLRRRAHWAPGPRLQRPDALDAFAPTAPGGP